MPEDISLEKPLAIIGEEDIVLGFGALGFKVYPVKELQEFSSVWDEVIAQKTAVCLIQENIYLTQEARINSYKNLALPVIIPFAKDAKIDLLEKIIKDIRLKATGTF